ncbi:hypothetical protein BEH94_06470 [Candidatus Altiarchaeales archaeon WOR_SM1_SCG]|nr:hypothetical protein BEH94_06470 [Candidatus Altiarchaeales archaeon WOR_SM1_SCG]
MENKREIILPAAVGIVGAVVFLFAFPGLAIPTIMHEILKLPSPGTGFGFIIGPFIIMCSLVAYGLIKKHGTAVITSTILAIFMPLIIFIFNLQMPKPGKFGSIEFIIGVIILGAALELVIYLLREKGISKTIKYIISAVVADIIFLAYSMLFIFSQTVPDKYVQLTINKILIIAGVSAAGAVIIGGLLPLLILKIIKFK